MGNDAEKSKKAKGLCCFQGAESDGEPGGGKHAREMRKDECERGAWDLGWLSYLDLQSLLR